MQFKFIWGQEEGFETLSVYSTLYDHGCPALYSNPKNPEGLKNLNHDRGLYSFTNYAVSFSSVPVRVKKTIFKQNTCIYTLWPFCPPPLPPPPNHNPYSGGYENLSFGRRVPGLLRYWKPTAKSPNSF